MAQQAKSLDDFMEAVLAIKADDEVPPPGAVRGPQAAPCPSGVAPPAGMPPAPPRGPVGVVPAPPAAPPGAGPHPSQSLGTPGQPLREDGREVGRASGAGSVYSVFSAHAGEAHSAMFLAARFPLNALPG